MRMLTVLNAASMAGKDPIYAFAFNSTELPLRRYFSLTENIPANSTMNLTLPYFDVGLRWIDAASDDRSQHVGDPKYADVANLDFSIRNNGSVAVIRNNTWDAGKATPQAAKTFSGTKLISIKVGSLGVNDQLPDGSVPNQNSPCPTMSAVFGKLPNVGQQTTSYFWSGPNSAWAANDCFLVAEASIKAGKYKGVDCTVSPAGAVDYIATCTVTPNSGAVKDDWISSLTLDFMSETMKYIVILNLTQPALDRPTIDEEGDGRDGHRNAAMAFGLGSPENPILVDLDGDEGYTESEPGSEQHPILIEDRDDIPQHDGTALGSETDGDAITRYYQSNIPAKEPGRSGWVSPARRHVRQFLGCYR